MTSNHSSLSRSSADEIEEGRAFAPKFDSDGLLTCVVTDAGSGDVLMVAHMNAEALQRSIATGQAWYYSRSRGALWRKGEVSGHVQRIVEIRVDCDQDALWIRVEQQGPGACHTGRRSCFYRSVPLGTAGAVVLEFRDPGRSFDPAAIYGEPSKSAPLTVICASLDWCLGGVDTAELGPASDNRTTLSSALSVPAIAWRVRDVGGRT